MALLAHLTDIVTEQASRLAPLTLIAPSPSASILQLSDFVHHLTTTPIHPVYFPYLRFGAIHAARVTTVWAAQTKGRKGRVGTLQDLFGYLVMAWGGSTVVSLLLGQPPSWLTSSAPWIIYPSIYLLLVPTGLSAYIVQTTPALLFNVFTAYVDGMTRGTTLSALPALVSQSSTGVGATANLTTYALLSSLAITSGGLFVGLFGLAGDSWSIGVPSLLKGGLLGTLDAWGAALVSIVYLALAGHLPVLAPLTNALLPILPSEFIVSSSSPESSPSIDPLHNRAIAILLFGTLLAFRAVITAFTAPSTKVAGKGKKVEKKDEFDLMLEKELSEVVKTPTKTRAGGNGKATPRKSARIKSRGSTPAQQ
ncbi:hypothetical protein L202_02531 [Cryptococcus amylolentus CBS 6039]|uniref:Uncharacterized protein n=2 Tax=Cryptococcus amylolentus TaxID=104669 RepID=A0A1E3I2W4_9TREE|nr:hypothetical protein L202_02531 [Cryptococcus amylolentus CBS 6039]ODN82246.1 hypothetical protein L202_02531 [Cryptococcus amylolentus CBS 6039]ODO09674.1 hypothetical protein I350_01888 [Cryptococcus amylolentus CBS 6273]